MFNAKKSQLTLIIIVGLLLLIVFAFVFSLKGELAPDAKSDEKLLYELESGLIKDHITSCIERVTSDAVERLGNNGGVIYDFEGGLIPFTQFEAQKDYLEYKVGARTFYVQHGLRENFYCSPIDYSHPTYPYAGLAFNGLDLAYRSADECAYGNAASDFDGVFGQVNLTKLCPFSSDSSCPIFAKGGAAGFTMKNQIEDYVARKLDLCVNLSYFGDQYGAEIVLESAATPRVSVRETDVQVSVTYPLRITFKNAAPISKMIEYHSSLEVRLGRLYFFLYDVLSKDSRDLSFDLEKNALASSYWSPGFELRKITSACATCTYPANYDDVVEVTDASSIVNGRPLLIRTSVQDRRPVLDFIPSESYDLASGGSVFQAQIPIKAVDPDDTPITYYFLTQGVSPGWRESPPGPSMIETQSSGYYLKSFLSSKDDLGVHNVRVLAVDESGFYDFQDFTITVQDSGFPNSVNQQDCMDICTLSQTQCYDWCLLSANPCSGECLGVFAPNDLTCNACVDPLFKAADPEPHVQCSGLAKSACTAEMPDCFWIEESAHLGSSAGCKNDYELGSSLRYASVQD